MPAWFCQSGLFYFGDCMADKFSINGSDGLISIRPEDLDDLLTRAAERGAERCLAHLGLENGHAAADIRDLRSLIESWRQASQTAWQPTVKVVTTGILACVS